MATIGTFKKSGNDYTGDIVTLSVQAKGVRITAQDKNGNDNAPTHRVGTATEIRDSRNYAGHRLSPWLGHLMVSRQETARPLLTPGEVMQLPPSDEVVLVSGVAPIRAKKARYYEDPQLKRRVLAPPEPKAGGCNLSSVPVRVDDWASLVVERRVDQDEDAKEGGLRREPELSKHDAIEAAAEQPEFNEFDGDAERDDEAVRQRLLARQARTAARQASMDPSDGIEL